MIVNHIMKLLEGICWVDIRHNIYPTDYHYLSYIWFAMAHHFATQPNNTARY